MGRPHLMREVAEKIQKNGYATSTVQIKKACHALQKLRHSGLISFKVADYRYLCRGLAHACEECGNVSLLDDDSALFSAVTAELRNLIISKEISSVTWNSLLFHYFDSLGNREESSKKNWLLLRALLADTREVMYANTPHKVKWLTVLQENPNLLQDNPCYTYAERLLAGDGEIADTLREDLRIPEHSWFWEEIILSQLNHIITYEDSRFNSHIPGMIALCKPHPTLVNKAIKILLSRYVESAYKSQEHKELKEFTLEKWGSPTFERQTKYGLVAEHVHQMVREWVVAEDLRDFFSLLQDDGKADERRFNFWSQFIPQITYSRIVLGVNAWNDHRTDFVNLRKNKAGRVSQLAGSTDSNNAFMMMIKDYLIVVFSEVGNACFIYNRKDINKNFEAKQQNARELKNLSSKRHRWIQIASWEIKFLEGLAQLGIHLEPNKPRITYRADGSYAPSSLSNIRSNTSTVASQKFDELEFEPFVRMHNLAVADNRSKGGVLWVLDKNITRAVREQLRIWNFKYKTGKGYWVE